MIDCLEKLASSSAQLVSDMHNQQQQRPPQQTNSLVPIYQQTGQLAEQSLVDLQQQQQQQSNLSTTGANHSELIGYYFGSISRETAEWILKTHGNQADGAYLLRSSGPNDDFVLSLLVNQRQTLDVLHYKIVETEDSFVALHGQLGDEKFATIDELIDKTHGVATKPRWPIHRQLLESQILPPTYWGLTVDQVRLAILIKAKQWGFPLLSTLFQNQQQQAESTAANNVNKQQQQHSLPIKQNSLNVGELAAEPVSNNETNLSSVTTLNNETIRTLVYKSLHEFQPWFHGKISREEAERRIEEGSLKDGRFLVRERDNYSYAMCISHKKTTKHYRIDVTPTGELAIQDGRKFTSLMALVSHYTIMSDGLWCALTEPCTRPIQNFNGNLLDFTGNLATAPNSSSLALAAPQNNRLLRTMLNTGDGMLINQNIYCVPPLGKSYVAGQLPYNNLPTTRSLDSQDSHHNCASGSSTNAKSQQGGLICPNQGAVTSLKAPIKEWLQTINHKWSQLMAAKSQHQSLNSFLFGSQNPLNNHCRHNHHHHHSRHHHNHHHMSHGRHKCKNGHSSCGCTNHQLALSPLGIDPPHSVGCSLSSKEPAFSLRKQPSANTNGQLLLSSTSSPLVSDPSGVALAAAGTMNRSHRDMITMSNAHNCCLANNHTHQQQALVSAGQQFNGLMPKNPVVQCNNNPSSSLINGISDQNCNNNSNNNLSTASLLYRLPQNSGFSLNSQSFIGSPLFAVRQQQQQSHQLDSSNTFKNQTLANNRSGGGSSGSQSGSGSNSYNVEEEKLISPAQSISANLNNHYNLSAADIYGSQTSTAIVNDQLPTSSSSSSGAARHPTMTRGSNNHMNNGNNNNSRTAIASKDQQPVPYGLATSGSIGTAAIAAGGRKAPNNKDHAPIIGETSKAPVMSSTNAVRHAGLILCGQHAGPAYRYTNCNDEKSFRPCLHRPSAAYRAADDSQLLTHSTHLAGPVAMAKFVQFQDGQCLRTHRDTRSIQMAYLSSKLAPQQNNRNLASQGNNINQVPLRESNSEQLYRQQQQHKQNHQIPQKLWTTGPYQCHLNLAGTHSRNVTHTPQSDAKWPENGRLVQATGQVNLGNRQSHFQGVQLQHGGGHGGSAAGDVMGWSSGRCGVDFDLMDCRESDDFEFKYDPKLIKSSSIETLCGAGDEEPFLEDLSNFKSNTELVMSLQPCWYSAQAQQASNDILLPIPMTQCQGDKMEVDNPLQSVNDNLSAQVGRSSPVTTGNYPFLSSTFEQLNENACHMNESHLDSINKKHDLEELTTALLAELTASLKAQVDLKNKRSGFGLYNSEKNSENNHAQQDNSSGVGNNNNHHDGNNNSDNASETNPRELINEFDTLIHQKR